MPKQTKPLRVWASMPPEQIPNELLASEVCILMGRSKASFFELKQSGELEVPELLPRIGAPRYSGAWMRARHRGELNEVGVSTVPRFLNKARRA